MTTKISNKHELVLNFIEQFQKFGPQVVDCFSNGMCWQFATILCCRFGPSADTRRMYDPVINHFAVWIDGRTYDITGDITDDPQYKFVQWEIYEYKDRAEAKRIRRDCIWKLPLDVKVCGMCEDCDFTDWGNYICCRDGSLVDRDHVCDKGE